MRALQSHFNSHQATALEDYVRLDEEYNMMELNAQLPNILQTVLQTAAWSLGLQVSDDEMKALIAACIQESQYER